MKKFIYTTFNEYSLNESSLSETKFIIGKNKFQLFLDDILLSETGFNVEKYDKWFNEKYVTLYSLKTFENFQGKGFAKHLLEQIFNYVKNTLNLNIITLIVDKNNSKAINLYLKSGFEIYMEYDESFSLIKKL